jgi:hypothetical protein
MYGVAFSRNITYAFIVHLIPSNGKNMLEKLEVR